MKPQTIKEAKADRLKSSHTKQDKGLLSKNETWDGYFDEITLLHNPSDENWRKRLIRTMLMEGSAGQMLEVIEFSVKYKIWRGTLARWTEKYPDIAKAYTEMKIMIASNRRVGCMKRKLDSYSSFRDIHLLDKQDDVVNRYHLDLKKMKDLEEQVKFLVEIVKPKVIDAHALKGIPQELVARLEQSKKDTEYDETV